MLKIYKDYLKEIQKGKQAEKLLWKVGLSRGRTGAKFFRNQKIGSYEIDLFAEDVNLIIELVKNKNSKYNSLRRLKFEAAGYSIIHVNEGDVLENVYRVLAEVECKVYSLKEKRA